MCGKDGSLVTAKKLTRSVIDPDSKIEAIVDLGLVGEPEKVDRTVLDAVLKAELIPGARAGLLGSRRHDL